MTAQLIKFATVGVMILVLDVQGNAQTNLLKNTKADLQSQSWRAYGEAAVEPCVTGDPCFVVRNGGHFFQDVTLPDDAVGQYALLVGRGASERINSDGGITGLPYLYGYMMLAEPQGRILDYLQGQNMSASPSRPNEWVTMSGIFRVPEGTKIIRFFLNQALGNGAPHNGSAARFDDLGLYLFAKETDARSFVKTRE